MADLTSLRLILNTWKGCVDGLKKNFDSSSFKNDTEAHQKQFQLSFDQASYGKHKCKFPSMSTYTLIGTL